MHKAESERNGPLPYAFQVRDACRVLGIGKTLLYALAKNGDIKLIRIAGRTLVPRSEIERLTRVEKTS